MTDNLKACPFCGNADALTVEVTENGQWWFVLCNNADCMTEACYDLGYSGAIEKWNTRPIEDELGAEIERLKAALQKIVEYDAREDCGRDWPQSVELLQDEAYTALKGGK